MATIRKVSLILGIGLLCLTSLTVSSVGAVDQRAADSDTVDVPVGQSASTCLSGAGSSFTVGSEDGAQIWIRLHLAGLTDSGGSFGAELTGSTANYRITEVMAGVEYTGDGFWDFVTSPIDSYKPVSAFDLQLPMFNTVMTGLDSTPSASNNSAESGDNSSKTEHNGAFRLLDC